MAGQGQPQGTHSPRTRLLVVYAGSNGIREKGCQYLSKLEGERVEKIDLNNWPSICRDGFMKAKIEWVLGGRGSW